MAGDGRWTRRCGAALLAVGIGLVAVGCGDDGGADAGSTTAPAPERAPVPLGASVSELDLCAVMGDAPATAFLAALGLGPIDQVQGRAAEEAAVCGWFLAPVGDATPEGVLVRIEPQVDGGNEVCTAPAANVAELSAGDGRGWVSEADGRVQAAVLAGEWCAYLQGPAGATPGPVAAAEASAALLGDTLAGLPTLE